MGADDLPRLSPVEAAARKIYALLPPISHADAGRVAREALIAAVNALPWSDEGLAGLREDLGLTGEGET